MKIHREQELFELDTRCAAGKILFQRVFSRAGHWKKSNTTIEHYSLPGRLQKRKQIVYTKITAKTIHFLKDLGFSEFRVILRCELRRIQHSSKHQQQKESIYIEITGTQKFSFLTPLADLDFTKLQELLIAEKKYFQKLVAPSKINFNSLVFSPSAFAYLLHEGLGHRQENDDHSVGLCLQSFPRTNFSVIDSPGNKKLLGHTPFDDYGTLGRDVILFHGPSRKTELMSAKSGNLRAINHEFHPIIRQRCLMVTLHNQPAPPNPIGSLRIEEVCSGSWNGDFLELEISKAVYTNKNSKEYRLLPFSLRMKPELVTFMTAFGENEISHPAGGCHKDLQRGLDVGFYTPSAYLSLKNYKKIKSFLEFLF